MKHIFIYTNKFKDKDLVITSKIKQLIESKGIRCTSQSIDVYERKKSLLQEPETLLIEKDVECIIVLGGDGTLLQAARDTMDLTIPLIGINLGTLGYMAEVDVENIEDAIQSIIHGHYNVEKRMMLEGKIIQANGNILTTWALNDMVLVRTGTMEIIRYNVLVNGQFLHTYSADGMIVTTPTGSTAYSLSAGGPIIEPCANVIMLTPVCPHSLINQRSIILCPEDIITIEIPEAIAGKQQLIELNIDGSHNIVLSPGSHIEIKKAVKFAYIIKLSKESFLEVLHKKMKET